MNTKPIPWMTLLAALLLAIPFIARSQDQIPAAINYQGHLTDSLGNPLSPGYYEIEFRIWDDSTQTGAGDFVWGRAFALHVVTNGLFNILLTDDGGLITSPTTPTNTLLTAFGGEDRYLGLTITTSNGVNIVSPSEISPRQQLASAPYAVQAQTANTVGPLGVTSTALGSGSVVAGKIAANAVTSGTIADGAVTTYKLNINADVHWNDFSLLLSGGGNAGLRHVNGSHPFASYAVDGPLLWGYAGGLLGTVNPTNVALEWRNDKSVTMNGAVTNSGPVTMNGALIVSGATIMNGAVTNNGSVTMNGAVTARSGQVSMFGPLVYGDYFDKQIQATTDGIVLFYGYQGHWRFRLWNSSKNSILTSYTYGDTGGANATMTSFPVAKGEYWQWDLDPNSTGNGSATNQVVWRPIGTD